MICQQNKNMGAVWNKNVLHDRFWIMVAYANSRTLFFSEIFFSKLFFIIRFWCDSIIYSRCYDPKLISESVESLAWFISATVILFWQRMLVVTRFFCVAKDQGAWWGRAIKPWIKETQLYIDQNSGLLLVSWPNLSTANYYFLWFWAFTPK